MISELNDNEIFDFLMTSDLADDYSPQELKYLLIKWRYFYRILHSNSERDIIDIKGKIKQMDDEVSIKNNEIIKIQIMCVKLEEEIKKIKNRKLTFKERLFGKLIIDDKNDDKI